MQTVFGEVPHFGVFCSSFIAKGVRFGPFQGKVVNASEVKTYGDNSVMWEVNLFLVGLLLKMVRETSGGKSWPLPFWESPGQRERTSRADICGLCCL